MQKQSKAHASDCRNWDANFDFEKFTPIIITVDFRVLIFQLQEKFGRQFCRIENPLSQYH